MLAAECFLMPLNTWGHADPSRCCLNSIAPGTDLAPILLCGRFTKCQQASVSAETHAKLAAHDILKNTANTLTETERLEVLCRLKLRRGNDPVRSCVRRLGVYIPFRLPPMNHLFTRLPVKAQRGISRSAAPLTPPAAPGQH